MPRRKYGHMVGAHLFSFLNFLRWPHVVLLRIPTWSVAPLVATDTLPRQPFQAWQNGCSQVRIQKRKRRTNKEKSSRPARKFYYMTGYFFRHSTHTVSSATKKVWSHGRSLPSHAPEQVQDMPSGETVPGAQGIKGGLEEAVRRKAPEVLRKKERQKAYQQG